MSLRLIICLLMLNINCSRTNNKQSYVKTKPIAPIKNISKKSNKELFFYILKDANFIKNDSILNLPFSSACDLVFKAALESDSLAYEAHFKLVPFLDGYLSEKYLSLGYYSKIFAISPVTCIRQAASDSTYYKALLSSWSYLPDVGDIEKFEASYYSADFFRKNNLSNNEIQILRELYDAMINSYELESGMKYPQTRK